MWTSISTLELNLQDFVRSVGVNVATCAWATLFTYTGSKIDMGGDDNLSIVLWMLHVDMHNKS